MELHAQLLHGAVGGVGESGAWGGWSGRGNGGAGRAMARGQGSLAVLECQWEVWLLSGQVMGSGQQRLPHRTARQTYHDPARRLRLQGLSRQRISRELFERFWQYVTTMPERDRHTFNAGWRLVVETWLRRQRWISVKAKPRTNVSTDSESLSSQNWLCTTQRQEADRGQLSFP